MTKPRQGLLCLALVFAGCEVGEGDPGVETAPCERDLCEGTDATGTGAGAAGAPAGAASEPSTAVDVLVVVDNSGWMGEEQALVGEQLGGLIETLNDRGYDARFAATTTDAGNYWCRSEAFSEPALGRFASSSCRQRLEDFHFGGDDSNAESICTEHCTLDSVRTSPQVPWIESSADSTNLVGGAEASDAAACLALAGINGCGYEAPLEALSLSLDRAQSPEDDEFGFLRDDAHLMVIIISDEADCSSNRQVEDAVFGRGAGRDQVFWPPSDEYKPPSSAICWNAGVKCSAGDCWPEDYDVDGNPTDNPDEAALVPVSQYLHQLEEVRSAKNLVGAEVFLFGILGVPEDYPETRVLTYTEGANAQDPQSFQALFGTAPGCSSGAGEAVPPVRLRALIEDDRMSPANNIYSICSTDYTPAFAAMADAVTSHGG